MCKDYCKVGCKYDFPDTMAGFTELTFHIIIDHGAKVNEKIKDFDWKPRRSNSPNYCESKVRLRY